MGFRSTLHAAGVWLIMAAAMITCTGCHDKEPVAPELEPGALKIEIDGLPPGADADVRINGPRGFFRTIGKSDLITPAPAGHYQFHAGDVRSGGFTWSANQPQLDTTLTQGDTLRWRVSYAASTGAAAINISGLPGGVPASVRLIGNGISRIANGSVVLGDLPPGTYSVFVDSLNAGGTAFTGTGPTTAVISASTTPTELYVRYSNVFGSLVITATGIAKQQSAIPQPASDSNSNGIPKARVQGPLNRDTVVLFGAPIKLPVGYYIVTPGPVVVENRLFAPTTRSVNRAVISLPTASQRDTLFIAYQEVKTPVNLTVENVTVTQTVQRSDNSIPLLAGRDVLLRAFVRSDRPSVTPPPARVRVFDGNTLLATLPLTPPSNGVPTVFQEGDLKANYTARISASLIKPQFRFAVEVDPDSTLGEVQRSDNVWPTGAPFAPSVVVAPPFAVRFVPIVLGNTVGNVTEANKERFLTLSKVLWPLNQISADVRAPFATSVTSLDATDSNGNWSVVLNELRALMVLDGAPPSMHYYGVVNVPYSQGMFGLALVGAPVAVGWDRADADTVAAHEWGHNFGRFHAPCGNAPSPDPGYPVIGGATGVAGWNSLTGELKSPAMADVMSYCKPVWVSDYNYTTALSFRLANAPSKLVSSGSSEGLLIWGRVTRDNVVIEPAFRVNTNSSQHELTSKQSDFVVELLDSKGSVIESHGLNTYALDHHGSDNQFATVIEWNDALERRLQAIRVRNLRSALLSATRYAGDSSVMGLLFDASSGKARGFVRKNNGGRGLISSSPLLRGNIIWSDGVRSGQFHANPHH